MTLILELSTDPVREGRDLVYETQASHLGDCWASVNLLLRMSENNGQVIRVSDYSDTGHFIGSGAPLEETGGMVFRISQLLESKGRLKIAHEFGEIKASSNDAFQNPYFPIKGGWKGQGSNKVACHLTGGTSWNQNLSKNEVERVVWELRRRGYDPIPVGLPLSLEESVEVMRGCGMFVGIDSGLSHVAHSFTGLPVHIMQARLPKEHVQWIHGVQEYFLESTAQSLVDHMGPPTECSEREDVPAKDVLILTANSLDYQKLSEISAPNKREYAERAGFRFAHWPMSDYCLKPWGERIMLMQKALKDCGWLWFTGADVMVTNYMIDCRKFMEGDLVIGWDNHGINNDSFFLKNSVAGNAFLEAVLEKRGECPDDQTAMWRVIADGVVPDLEVSIRPQSYFNSYRYDLYHNYMEWPAAKEGQWLGGHFVLHLPGLPMAQRLATMRQTLGMVIK